MKDDKLNLGFSKLTIGFGLYIVVSASFILQVNNLMIAAFGTPFLRGMFWLVTLLIVLVVLIYAIFTNLKFSRTLTVILIFLIAYQVSTMQRYFDEKTHILMYGILGYLAVKDLLHAKRFIRRDAIMRSLAFVFIVSACDELFQLILPYRFGEINDFLTNIIGGILGIWLYTQLFCLEKKSTV